MNVDYFLHPKRFPKNVDGPFYTIGCISCSQGGQATWCGDCMQCEAPEAEAPDLLAPLNQENTDTYFVRQPQTSGEIERACSAISVCCVYALRYGGKDKTIIQRLRNDPEACDFVLNNDGEITPAVDSQGNYLPFASELIALKRAKLEAQWPKSRITRILKWLLRRV
jgi:hypothetical protein